MSEKEVRRRPRVLSPETKWEIFLEVTSREMTQADAARRCVDVSTIIGIRRAAKDAARRAGGSAGPAGQGAQLGAGAGPLGGRPVDRGGQGPSHRARGAAGKSRLGLSGPLPARVPGETKEQILELIDDAVRAGALPTGGVLAKTTACAAAPRDGSSPTPPGSPAASSRTTSPAGPPASAKSTPQNNSPSRPPSATGSSPWRAASSTTQAATDCACDGVGARNSAVVVDLPRCGPMLSPRVPNLVPIPGPRMERETPGQRPRPNYGHPQGS